MPLHIGLKLNREIAEHVAGRIGSDARVSGNRLEIFDAMGGDWSRVLRILREESYVLETPSSFVLAETGRSVAWGRDRNVTAAVLVPDDTQRAANDRCDYSPQLPDPDQGYLPKGTPVRLSRAPRAPLCSVAEELVFASALGAYLRRLDHDAVDEHTILKGQPTADWVRLHFSRSLRVVDEVSYLPALPCRLCGAPYVPDSGVWVGIDSQPPGLSVALEAMGYRHLAGC